jgi:hypothetical protein
LDNVGWIKRFILFHGKHHPAEMGKPEIERFLTALAVESSSGRLQRATVPLLLLHRASSAPAAAGRSSKSRWDDHAMIQDPRWLIVAMREPLRGHACSPRRPQNATEA